MCALAEVLGFGGFRGCGWAGRAGCFFFGVDQDIIILLSESNRSVGAGRDGGLGVKLMGTGGGVWLKERTGVELAGFTVVEALN